jgi:hypothetical protein
VSRSSVLRSETCAPSSSWVMEFCSLFVDCRDEDDAKTIVRALRYRAGLVARTAFGVSPGRPIQGADVAAVGMSARNGLGAAWRALGGYKSCRPIWLPLESADRRPVLMLSR